MENIIIRETYLKQNIIPVIIEALFIISCFVISEEYYIYTNFIFYLCLFIYFKAIKLFSFKEWMKSLKSGKKFWAQVTVTTVLFIAAFAVSSLLESAFSNLNAGYIKLRADSWLEIILLALSTMLMPPIVEELFYRKSLVLFENKGVLAVTALIGMFLYALEHSLNVWGIILTMIWAIPLTFSYVKTRNIYVPMTAHLICNILGNGPDIVMGIFSRIR